MSCNCKKVKSLQNKIINNNNGKSNKSAFGDIISFITNALISVINRLVVILIILLMTPIVSVVLIVNYALKQKLIFTVPDIITNKIKNSNG